MFYHEVLGMESLFYRIILDLYIIYGNNLCTIVSREVIRLNADQIVVSRFGLDEIFNYL